LNIKFILTLIISFSLSFFYAQKSTLSGIISDENNKTIPFANIVDLISGKGVASDDNGEFRFVLDSISEINVRISAVGYKTVSKSFQSEKLNGGLDKIKSNFISGKLSLANVSLFDLPKSAPNPLIAIFIDANLQVVGLLSCP